MSAAIVFPVRYVSGCAAIQTTSRELSQLGIAVRSLAPPPPGARLSMALYLPRRRVPEVAIARVARLDGQGGFWAEFVVLDAAARMRIGELLASLPMQAPNSPEQRTFDRLAVGLRVRLHTQRELAVEHATNLSRGGVFIRCEGSPAVNEPVEVHLELPDGEVVSSRGVVAHVAEKGVGVQFVDATDRFRERIDRYMESLRGTARPSAS